MFLFALLILAIANASPLEPISDPMLKTNQWDQEGSLSELNQLFVDYDTNEDAHVDPDGLKEEKEEVPEERPSYGMSKLDPAMKERILADIRDEAHMNNEEQPEDEVLAAEFNHEKIAPDAALGDIPDNSDHLFIGEPTDSEKVGLAEPSNLEPEPKE